MIPIPSSVRVWIATGHTDMRRGMQGLALAVQESSKRDPHAGDLYIFRGRSGDLVKILWHDGIGLSLYAKRLDRGKFTISLLTATTVLPMADRWLEKGHLSMAKAIASDKKPNAASETCARPQGGGGGRIPDGAATGYGSVPRTLHRAAPRRSAGRQSAGSAAALVALEPRRHSPRRDPPRDEDMTSPYISSINWR
jgi:transposase